MQKRSVSTAAPIVLSPKETESGTVKKANHLRNALNFFRSRAKSLQKFVAIDSAFMPQALPPK